jgi:plastocyanin
MNKFVIIGILAVLIIGGGVVYKQFILAQKDKPVTTGVVKNFTVTAIGDEWKFEPEDIEVNRGDKIIMKVVNEDDYDHGIAIDAYGISQRMPAKSDPQTHGIITIELVATQAGEFPFYCSVPCGEGTVDGVKRGHFEMVGRIRVKDLINQ